MKDIDYENLIKSQFLSIDIADEDMDLILKTIKRDVQLFKDTKLMDYSLLLGVEKVKPKE